MPGFFAGRMQLQPAARASCCRGAITDRLMSLLIYKQQPRPAGASQHKRACPVLQKTSCHARYLHLWQETGSAPTDPLKYKRPAAEGRGAFEMRSRLGSGDPACYKAEKLVYGTLPGEKREDRPAPYPEPSHLKQDRVVGIIYLEPFPECLYGDGLLVVQ